MVVLPSYDLGNSAVAVQDGLLHLAFLHNNLSYLMVLAPRSVVEQDTLGEHLNYTVTSDMESHN